MGVCFFCARVLMKRGESGSWNPMELHNSQLAPFSIRLPGSGTRSCRPCSFQNSSRNFMRVKRSLKRRVKRSLLFFGAVADRTGDRRKVFRIAPFIIMGACSSENVHENFLQYGLIDELTNARDIPVGKMRLQNNHIVIWGMQVNETVRYMHNFRPACRHHSQPGRKQQLTTSYF